MEEKIKLSEYLELAVKFSEDPNEENLNSLNLLINRIQVKEFLYLEDKEIACAKVLSAFNDEFSATGLARFIEIGKVVYGLFDYCTNFENDLGLVALSTPSIYNTVMINGLYDYIYSKCLVDYQRLLSMIDSAINAFNISKIIETANMFSPENFDKWENSIKDIKKDLDSNMVKDIIQVAKMYTDNGSSSLERSLNEIAVEEVNKKAEKDSTVFKKIAEDLNKKEN